MISPSSSPMILHPPHFFVVVLKLNLRHKKMMVPESFVKEYGKFLSSSSVNLQIPDGKKWNVGLTVAPDGAVWLQNGWDVFAEYYGLEFGSFLVFRFDGRSSFHTTIFKMDGSEMKYYCHFEEHDEDSYEDLNVFSQQPKKRKNASFYPQIEPEEEGFTVSKDMSSCKKLIVAKDEFNSEFELPCFKFVMRHSNVGGRYDMIIPKDFAGKHLSDEFGIIQLRISNGRTWSLVYRWNRNQGNFAYISSGWKRFAEENQLKEGDIGFFQMIEKNQILFSKSQAPSPPIMPTTRTTKNPFFELNIVSGKRSTRSVLNVPVQFSKEHLSPNLQSAELEVGEETWRVKVKRYNNRVRFSAGWTDFYDHNCLRDTSCLFEMINKEQCVFKVTISKILLSICDSEEDSL